MMHQNTTLRKSFRTKAVESRKPSTMPMKLTDAEEEADDDKIREEQEDAEPAATTEPDVPPAADMENTRKGRRRMLS